MNALQAFRDERFGTIRTLDEHGKTFWCASDVAQALGYRKPNDAVNKHCRATTKRGIPVSGKIQDVNFITEGDLYRLITHSRLPAAEAFEKWVFEEVLPTIRRTGQYGGKEGMLPTMGRPALPETQDKSKARRNWLNYMLAALEGQLGLTRANMLHQAYESMKADGGDPDAAKRRYMEATGLSECSTFDAVCNDREAAIELADILHSNMKIVFIKRCL